jgi:hypothetical protein
MSLSLISISPIFAFPDSSRPWIAEARATQVTSIATATERIHVRVVGIVASGEHKVITRTG